MATGLAGKQAIVCVAASSLAVFNLQTTEIRNQDRSSVAHIKHFSVFTIKATCRGQKL